MRDSLVRSTNAVAAMVLWAVVITSGLASEPESINGLFKNYCTSCHQGDDAEGGIALDELALLNSENAEFWQRILMQLATGEMPPDGEKRPSLDKREEVIGWITAGLTSAGVEPRLPGGPLPTDGNLIDHDRLFSGKFKGPAYSPPRFWRRSQSQYDALMEMLWVIPKLRYEKAHRRSESKWAAYSYSRPFPSLDPASFTNYSGSIHADEAVLRALMDAGGQIADRLMSDKPAYDNFVQPPIANGIPSIRRGSKWEKYKLELPTRPEEFEPFVSTDVMPDANQQRLALERVFKIILQRSPTSDEHERYGGLLERTLAKNGSQAALRGLITAVMVSPEFVFRMEVGIGEQLPDGRRRLSSRELVYAIAYALTDDGPDQELWDAAKAGRLNTTSDVEREVRRILSDPAIEKHRKLRFFQEFFGYHRATEVFKDEPGWKQEVQYLVRDADLLVEHVMESDRDVFAQLLTTDSFFVAYPKIENQELFDAIIANTIEETKASIERQKKSGKGIKAHQQGRYNRNWIFTQGLMPIPRTVHNDRGYFETSYIRVYGFDLNEFNWTREQPIKVPGRRAGILTHPAWLVAHSQNFDNYVVGRGHWIREHLLAGKIPDVPLDVEAKIPDEPNETLRHRMRVTREEKCIRCHRRMDPLGFPFEMYDHFGHFRTAEKVGERKTKDVPVDSTGAIIASGETELDGNVGDAIELVHRLAKSNRVRQSIVRHAFRYWLGRNEMLSDSPTLMAADRAYVENDGSFNELVVSLLTSDSFLYRK